MLLKCLLAQEGFSNTEQMTAERCIILADEFNKFDLLSLDCCLFL